MSQALRVRNSYRQSAMSMNVCVDASVELAPLDQFSFSVIEFVMQIHLFIYLIAAQAFKHAELMHSPGK